MAIPRGIRDGLRSVRWRPWRLAALAVLGLIGALGFAPAHAAQPPERVVSIGGDITEIVFALGAGDRVIAVDSTSEHPEAARDLPDIGYFRRLAAEPVIALEPDLVLARAASGPPPVLEQLQRADVHLVIIPDEPNLDGVLTKIAAVGDALGREAEAAALAGEVETATAAIVDAVAELGERPRTLFLLNPGPGAILAAGRKTSAAAIIELAGGRNAVDGFTGYRPLSPEAAIVAAPEVVLVPTRTLEALGGAQGVLERAELRLSPAAASGRVVAMDALLLLGFGPRVGEAVTTLAQALHPELDLAPTTP